MLCLVPSLLYRALGDFLGFNPHLHVLIFDSCFYGNGMFKVGPSFDTKNLEKIFRHKVFKILIYKGIITQDLVNMLLSWPPSRRPAARRAAFRFQCSLLA